MDGTGEWLLYKRLDPTGFSDHVLDRSTPTVPIAPSLLGRPLFVDTKGQEHAVLNAFFRSPPALVLADTSQWRYAYSLRSWVNFLNRRGEEWDTATGDSMAAFKFWRRSDPANDSRISGSAWKSDLAAYLRFYEWTERRYGAAGPFVGEVGAGFKRELSSSRFATNRVRSSDVKWLTPAAYARWLSIGLLGYDRHGVEKPTWRHRSEERDEAFVNGLYRSGLRLQEWSSVLTIELPKSDSAMRFRTLKLASACAKGAYGRNYWLRTDVLGQIETYLEHERARSVQRAQRDSLYERLPNRIVVHGNLAHGTTQASDASGRLFDLDLDALTPNERCCLFLRTGRGLEPLHLWLNENGLPRTKRAWYRTFDGANSRVAGEGLAGLRCHPHMLRHSFALRWYAVGRSVWENKLSHLTGSEREDFRSQFGDTWGVIQGLLGHRNVETTRNVYLEPFRNLNTTLLLEQVDDDDLAQMQLRFLRNDPRVADDPMLRGMNR